MNFINIFVTTMIIGIGVDYGIYVIPPVPGGGATCRTRSSRRGILETCKAVLAAATCTIVGFGSITFSHYPGPDLHGPRLRSSVLYAPRWSLSPCCPPF